MRVTRTIALLVTTLALTVGLAFSQSLAEIAKKEKQRRDTNQTESKTVITDRELSQSFGGLTAAQSSTVDGADGDDAADDSAEGQEDEVQDETKTREYWQNRVGGAKEKIAKLESELNDGDWGEGQAVGVDPRGQNNLARREQSEQQLQAARAELEAIRAEARRAGAPPGWAR